jgi:hypothetical protein
MAPDADLAAVLDGTDLAGLSAFDLADVVAGWERLAAWVQARQAEALTALTEREEMRVDDGKRFSSLSPEAVTAGDLCTVWPWTKPQAERLVQNGVKLVKRFSATHRALAAGRLDARRAGIILAELGTQDTDVARVVESAVLPHVRSWTSVKLRRVLRRLIHELAPESAKKKNRRARSEREVWSEPGRDGMSWLHAYLPDEQVAAIMATIKAGAESEKGLDCDHSHTCPNRYGSDAPAERGAHQSRNHTARSGSTECGEGTGGAREGAAATGGSSADRASAGGSSEGEAAESGSGERRPAAAAPCGGCATRTSAQRQADALAALAWSSLRTGRLGSGGCSSCGSGCSSCGAAAGVPLASSHGRPVSVNMTMSLSTWLRLDEHPAHLEGHGPIDAETARHLAAAGLWRWVLTDPVGGHALDYGRTRYTPPQELVDFILIRDPECVMPGCHRPGYRCEIDHRIPYPEGPTSACNCSALCKPCHLQKHRAGWNVDQLAPGVQRWTSPSGHQQIVELPRLAPPPPPHPAPDPPDEPSPMKEVPPF